jgi:crossover junction endodeoxyribonuclease RuvC
VRVLGIDPGSSCTGFGILEETGGKLELVASGVIRAARGPLPERLACIFAALESLIGQHRPEAAAVEEVFTGHNARSALVLGEARGVALLALARAGVAIHEYPTRTIKQTVTGSGAADKRQVQRMLQMLLGRAPKQLDASDALAAALCHLRWGAGKEARR